MHTESWAAAPAKQAPWSTGAQWTEWRPRSPRRVSPRRRGKGSGGYDQQPNKGKGKEKSEKQERKPLASAASAETLTVRTMPKAPAVPQMATKNQDGKETAPATSAAATPATASSTADDGANKQLQALMQALQGWDSLPPAVKDMMESAQQENNKKVSASLHKKVTEQARARKDLVELRRQRGEYLAGWSQYLQDLLQTLQKQFGERNNTLEQLYNQEGNLMQALQAASMEVKRLSTLQQKVDPGDVVHVDSPEEGMSDAEADVSQAAEIDAKRRHQMQALKQEDLSLHQLLEQALETTAKQAAAYGEPVTPRSRPAKRAAREGGGETAGTEEAKAKPPEPPFTKA